MKYKVVYYIESSGFGGAELMLLNLLQELDRDYWEPILVYHIHPGIIPLIDRVKGLGITTLSVPSIAGFGDLSGMKALIKKLRELHPAVFHAHLVWNLKCSFGIMCAYLAGAKAIVATQHLYQELQARRFHRIYKRVIYQKLISMLVDRYIAVSYKQAEHLKKAIICRNKVKVVQNCVNVKDFCDRTDSALLKSILKNNEEKPIVLTVARLSKRKGNGYLIEAATMVPEAIFLFAGDGTEWTNLENQARELNIAERVVFLGQRNDIPELLNACDLFVLPSLQEGLPLSILEAMAASKPVIASDIEGVNEIIINGQNGFLVPPANASALAEKINLVLSDKPLAKRISAKGKEHVTREFSTERMVAGVTNIYEEILIQKRITGK